MTSQYYHLRLVRWPFPIVPNREYCTFMADRQQLRSDIELLLTTLARRDTSSIHLFWAWFGAGKTHSLFYVANQTRELNKSNTGIQLYAVYSEFPKAARSYLDLYRSFMTYLDVDTLINAFLEVCTCQDSNRLRKNLELASPDLANALQALVTGTTDDQVIARRWLRAESLPISEFRKIGISRKINSAEEAIQIFAALISLLNVSAQCQGRLGFRIVWMLDEFQRIEQCSAYARDEINTGIHSTFNACPIGLSLFLSFSNRPSPDGLPTWFSSELRDRIGRTRVMILPPMLPKEAINFVKDVLVQHRVPEYSNQSPYFPFSEETCKVIIEEIQKRDELKPRSIMHAFNAVLQEADPQIESGKMESVSPQYARDVLANYVVFKDNEDG
ncbi:MAG: hypothetical protein AB1750_06725 [Chloroflexota bacterium]